MWNIKKPIRGNAITAATTEQITIRTMELTWVPDLLIKYIARLTTKAMNVMTMLVRKDTKNR